MYSIDHKPQNIYLNYLKVEVNSEQANTLGVDDNQQQEHTIEPAVFLWHFTSKALLVKVPRKLWAWTFCHPTKQVCLCWLTSEGKPASLLFWSRKMWGHCNQSQLCRIQQKYILSWHGAHQVVSHFKVSHWSARDYTANMTNKSNPVLCISVKQHTRSSTLLQISWK